MVEVPGASHPQGPGSFDSSTPSTSAQASPVYGLAVVIVRAVAADAPSILSHLTDDDRTHFDGLQETLTRLGTPYRVDGSLVRGLDYYTRTLFEVLGKGEGLGAQNALLGGGRYDQMVKSLGGPDTPAIGFAMGLERLLMAMPESEDAAHIDVFIVAAQSSVRAEAALLGREPDRHDLGLCASALSHGPCPSTNWF